MRKSLYIVVAVSLSLLSSCGESAPNSERARGDSTTATAAERADTGSPTAPAETADTTQTFDPIDPASGSLTITASGDHAGTWTFKDVNGSVNERAGGGETKTSLQLEAHSEPVHFKLRLATSSGEFDAGVYTVGGDERAVDVTYENAGAIYKSFGTSKGSVSVTSITDDRAAGTFDVSLETLEEKPRLATVTGSFDMRIQR